jgi:hypothetical protein
MILSARDGLLDPEEEIETYDVALARLSVAERAEWGRRVVAALERRLGPLDGWIFEVHAGAAYRHGIEGLLAERGARVVAPLAHLSIGQQFVWYADQIDVLRRRTGKRGARSARGLRQFQTAVEQLPPLLSALITAPAYRVVDHPSIPAVPGIYLFSDQRPVYVGQSRNLRSRLQQHTRKRNRENQASLAFSIAKREAANDGVNIKRGRAVLERDPEFQAHFDNAKARVGNMTVQFVVLADPVERTLFEVYAALALNTAEFNSWETH